MAKPAGEKADDRHLAGYRALQPMPVLPLRPASALLPDTKPDRTELRMLSHLLAEFSKHRNEPVLLSLLGGGQHCGRHCCHWQQTARAGPEPESDQ